MKTLFVVGATGYIGGSVAARLVEAGYTVRGLVRGADRAPLLTARGIEPVIGSLEDAALMTASARAADGVVNAAHADDADLARALLAGMAGSGKPYLHTSGSSVIADDAGGDSLARQVFDETTPFVVDPAKQPRRDLELEVLAAAERGVRAVVVSPSLIYGSGLGLNRDSVQVPALMRNAVAQGRVEIVGRGLNAWSTVPIRDLAELYRLALEKAPAGAYYFAENGEASFVEIGRAIATRLGLGPVASLSREAAIERFGPNPARFSLGGNSRVRARRARTELGWAPTPSSLIDWIVDRMPVPAA